MNFLSMAELKELYFLDTSETEEKAFDVIFSNIIIEICLKGEPLNSSIESLKNISCLNDSKISSIVSFLKSLDLGVEGQEFIFKEILNIIRDNVKVEVDYTDYTYLTEPVTTPTKTVLDTVDLTKFASLPPQPYLSWVISDDLTTWEPPVEYPDGNGDGLNIEYIWNETEKKFDPRLPDEPKPFPSWIPSDPFTNLEFSMVWIPPKPYPDGTGKGYNKSYRWNEETLTWQDILV